jgi:hypothetical protein
MSPSRSGRGTGTSSSPRRDHVSPIRILPVTFFDRHREMVDGIAKNSCDRIIIESFTADANQVKLMLSQKFCVVVGLRLSESGHATQGVPRKCGRQSCEAQTPPRSRVFVPRKSNTGRPVPPTDRCISPHTACALSHRFNLAEVP